MKNYQKPFLILSAILLLVMGVPNMLAAVWMATGEPLYRDLGEGKTLSADEAALLVESREAAWALAGLPRGATDLGAAYLAGGVTPENLDRALDMMRKGIEEAPMNAFAWQRLAGLLSLKPGNREEGVRAWRAARQLAEHEPFLLHDRIRVGVGLYHGMSAEDRDALRQDAERAYAKNRGGLRAYGRNNNLLEWLKFLLRDEEKTRFLSS